MRTKKIGFFLVIAILVLAGFQCKQEKSSENSSSGKQTESTSEKHQDTSINKSEKGNEESADSLLLFFKATACYGTCPIYELEVRENGMANLNVIKFGERIPFGTFRDKGKYKTKIGKGKMDTLASLPSRFGFFTMADEYPEENVIVSDLPTTIIKYSIEGRKKKVINRNYKAPKELEALEKEILEALNGLNWAIINAEE